MNKEATLRPTDAEIIRMIGESEEGLNEALECLYLREDLQRTAFRIFQKFKRKLDLFTWQDIFSESLLRLALGILIKKREIASGIGGFFAGICQNYCQELYRKSENKLETAPEWFLHPEKLVFDKEIEAILREILTRQSDQCQQIFRFLFFGAAAWSMEDIARELDLAGARSAITTYYRCKKKLLEYIEEHEGLRDRLRGYF